MQASCLQNIVLLSQIFLCYNYFPSNLHQFHAHSKDPVADFLGLAAPSPQSWGAQGGSASSDCLSGTDLGEVRQDQKAFA